MGVALFDQSNVSFSVFLKALFNSNTSILCGEELSAHLEVPELLHSWNTWVLMGTVGLCLSTEWVNWQQKILLFRQIEQIVIHRSINNPPFHQCEYVSVIVKCVVSVEWHWSRHMSFICWALQLCAAHCNLLRWLMLLWWCTQSVAFFSSLNWNKQLCGSG